MQEWMVTTQQLTTEFGLRVIAAIAIFLVGRWVAKILTGLVRKLLNRNEIDATLVKFVSNLVHVALLVFVVLAALGQLGIETTSFIAVLGAAGLAVGLALQGSLSNFAAGILMIIFRPFRVGDLVNANGVFGKVEEISIFTTQILTPDNKTIIVPNSKVTDDNIINWSSRGKIRLDLVFGIAYDADMDSAKQIMMEVMSSDERVLKSPAPRVGLLELADSSVNFACRPWVEPKDYWDVHFHIMETVKRKFDESGITIPFPQRDVHLYEHKG